MQKLVDEQHRRMLTGHAPAEEETDATEATPPPEADSKGALILQPKTFPLLYASSSSGGANSYVPVEVGDIPTFSELSLTRVCAYVGVMLVRVEAGTACIGLHLRSGDAQDEHQDSATTPHVVYMNANSFLTSAPIHCS